MAGLLRASEVKLHKITARDVGRRFRTHAIAVRLKNAVCDQSTLGDQSGIQTVQFNVGIGFFGCFFQIGNINALVIDLHLFGEHIESAVFAVYIEVYETVVNVVRNIQCITEHEAERIVKHGLVGVIGKEDPRFGFSHTEKIRF